MPAPLKLIPGEGLGDEQAAHAAGREAWGIVAAAYDQAVTTVGLSSDDRASMIRQRRCAYQLAGRPALAGA